MLDTYAVIKTLAFEQHVKWPCGQLSCLNNSHGPNIFTHYYVLSIYLLISLFIYSNCVCVAFHNFMDASQ